MLGIILKWNLFITLSIFFAQCSFCVTHLFNCFSNQVVASSGTFPSLVLIFKFYNLLHLLQGTSRHNCLSFIWPVFNLFLSLNLIQHVCTPTYRIAEPFISFCIIRGLLSESHKLSTLLTLGTFQSIYSLRPCIAPNISSGTLSYLV